MTEERVIVDVAPEVFLHEEGMYAARIQPLGLTAYADSEQDAVAKLKVLFGALIATLRKAGILEECLNASGLEWCWEDGFVGEVEFVKIPL